VEQIVTNEHLSKRLGWTQLSALWIHRSHCTEPVIFATRLTDPYQSLLDRRLLVLPVRKISSFTPLTDLSGSPIPSRSTSPASFLYWTHSTLPVFVHIFHRDGSNCFIIHYVYIYKNLFYKDSTFQITSISYIIIRLCYLRFYILLQKVRKCTAKPPFISSVARDVSNP
jgi:hypothetical protein